MSLKELEHALTKVGKTECQGCIDGNKENSCCVNLLHREVTAEPITVLINIHWKRAGSFLRPRQMASATLKPLCF